MEDAIRKFCQNIIDNIKKNGFPEKKIAFPLMRLYESAEKKGINLNKVLDTLRAIEIEHEKTPDKIIFFPKPKAEPPKVEPPHPFAGIDFSNMDLSKMMSMAGELMKQMTPEQLAEAERMTRNMSPEESAALIEQAKQMGLFPKDKE